MQFNFTCPFETFSNKIAIIGGGEIAKQLTIIAQNLSIETHIITNNKFSPAGQVSHEEHVIDIKDKFLLKSKIQNINPTITILENTLANLDALSDLENGGFYIYPNIRTVEISNNKESVSDIINNNTLFKTINQKFVYSVEDLEEAIEIIGLPCIVKSIYKTDKFEPIYIDRKTNIEKTIYNKLSINNGVLIQKVIDFDEEISLFGIRFKNIDYSSISEISYSIDVKFSPPISKYIANNEFICSWQPSNISEVAMSKCKEIALFLINYLGGIGIYNFIFFIKDGEVYFNKFTPFPDNSGFLTIHTQNISQFEIFMRTILELPISKIQLKIGGVARPIFSDSYKVVTVPKKNFLVDNTYFYIFGKRYDDYVKGMIVHTERDVVDAI